MARGAWAVLFALLAGATPGCGWTVPSFTGGQDGGARADTADDVVATDAPQGDTARDDTGPDAVTPPDDAPCGAGTVLCDGVCTDTQTSVAHCGGCGRACTAGPNSEASCVAGVCAYTCAEGFANCAGDPAMGCTTPVGSDTSCGSCVAAPRVCPVESGYVCRPALGAAQLTYQCCRGVVRCSECPPEDPECEAGGCNVGEACVHSTDFDLCCQR